MSCLSSSLGVIFVIIVKEVTKFLTNLVISTFCKIFNIKYITKSPRSKFYTGYTENYLLPPIYKDKVRVTLLEGKDLQNYHIMSANPLAFLGLICYLLQNRVRDKVKRAISILRSTSKSIFFYSKRVIKIKMLKSNKYGKLSGGL